MIGTSSINNDPITTRDGTAAQETDTHSADGIPTTNTNSSTTSGGSSAKPGLSYDGKVALICSITIGVPATIAGIIAVWPIITGKKRVS